MASPLQNDIFFQAFSLLVLQKRRTAEYITQNYRKLQYFCLFGDVLRESVLIRQWTATDKSSSLSKQGQILISWK